MGFDLGKLVRNVLTGGSTYFRDQRRARHERRDARDLIAENTDLAQQLFDEDLGSSALANLAADPALRAQQQDVLGRYGQMSREGFTSQDRDALNQAFMQSRGEEQSQRGAALDAAARRGDVSGGNALQAALGAAQGGANRGAQFATDVGLAGRQRALDALANQGQLAGQMRGQQFGEDAARGSAMDQFRQWAAGERSGRAGMLMNARGGQAQSMNTHAQELANSDTAGMVAQGALNVWTGGISGAATGAMDNSVGAPGSAQAKGMPTPTAPGGGTPPVAAGPQQKGMPPGGAAQRTTTFGGAPRPGGLGGDPRMSALSQIAGTGGVQPQQRRPRRPGMGV